MNRPVIAGLETVWRSIDQLCSDLTDEEWRSPTDCPGWSVQDNLSHIVGTESSLLGRKAAPIDTAELRHVKSPMGAGNEAWVAERRDRPGPAVLEEFREVTALRLDWLRGLDDEGWDQPMDTPLGKGTYAGMMAIRLFDCWVHEQDMRLAVSQPGHLDGPVAEQAFARLVDGLGFVIGKRVAPPDGTTVVVELTGPLERTVAYRVDGGRAGPLTEPPEHPSVTLHMSDQIFGRLACGRRDPEVAIAERRVRIEGDIALGRRVVANLPITP
jgi:uncharacterized protein (TIGR03083 family)